MKHEGRGAWSARLALLGATWAVSCGGPASSSVPTRAEPLRPAAPAPAPTGAAASPPGVSSVAPLAIATEPAPFALPYEPRSLFVGPRDPSGSHPEILSVDSARRRAFVRSSVGEPSVVTITTVDLTERVVLDTWQNDRAHPVNMFGFARLAFQPFTSRRSDDLVRLAAIAAHADERSLGVPSISVSRDASRIAYLVMAPPKMQVAVADGAGANERRIGTPRMRGEDPVLSPDGRWVAFSACSPDATSHDCARSLHVADLESARPTPRKLDVARPSTLAWDADSRGLWTTNAIARARARTRTDERRSCLHHVDVQAGRSEELVCAEGVFDTDFALAPSRQKAVFVARRGEPPGGAFSLRVCDLASRRCEEEMPIPMLVAPPLLTDDGFVVSAGYLGLPWSLHLPTRRHGTLRGPGWYGRAVRHEAPHGFVWVELGSGAAKEPGGDRPPAFAIRELDAGAVSRAGPPATR